jgi:hypothetical protein
MEMAEWGFYPVAVIEARTSTGSRKPSKHVGRTTGMGIEQYQDYTLYINDDRDVLTGRKLTDEQLCADWQWEFPDAVMFIPFHVKGVRRDFVAGKRREGQGGSAHGVRGADGAVVGGADSTQY